MTKALRSITILIVLLSGQTSAFSQKLVLYYNINETVPVDNFARLDSLLSKLKKGDYDVSIVGFADFLYNTQYNQALSLKRAQKTKNKLSKDASGFSFN